MQRWPWTATRHPPPTPTGTWSSRRTSPSAATSTSRSRSRAAPRRCRSTNVEGIVQSSIDIPEGTYEATTSDDNYTGKLANQFFKNAQRSQLGNFYSLPTDCPQRNERMGWTGDLQAYARSATYNSSDTQAFLRQWLIALRDAQGVNGGIGDTVPIISLTGDRGTNYPQSPTWEGAVAQAPWQLYTQYGDTQVIRENFPTIKKWLDSYLANGGALSPDYPGLTSRTSGNADHISMDTNTQAHMVGQAMYLYYLDISSKMADIIGDSAYAETLRQRYTQGVDSFNRLYVDPQTGFTLNATPGATLVSGRTLQDSQASYATPLALDLFSDTMKVQAGPNAGLTYKEFATKRLAELIADPAKSNNGAGPLAGTGLFSGGQASNKPYTITTGFNGTPNILPALTKNGDAATAYKLFSNDKFASWLYPVTLGATSMWELWNSYERGLGQGGDSTMNSQNHFALGASQAWMYEYQLGITSNGAKGYRDFVLQPTPGGEFTSAQGRLPVELRLHRLGLDRVERQAHLVLDHGAGQHDRHALPPGGGRGHRGRTSPAPRSRAWTSATVRPSRSSRSVPAATRSRSTAARWP